MGKFTVYKLGNELLLQWNPVNTATNGPPKIGHINGVAVLTMKIQILEFKR